MGVQSAHETSCCIGIPQTMDGIQIKTGTIPLIMSQFNKEFTEITVLRGMQFYQVVTEDSEKISPSIFRAA